jgi:hypothetical protein
MENFLKKVPDIKIKVHKALNGIEAVDIFKK